MSNNKQTAVEWLEQEFEKRLPLGVGDVLIDLIKQAKEMEKKQIMKAVYDSMGTNLDPNIGRAEIYYNETFNK